MSASPFRDPAPPPPSDEPIPARRVDWGSSLVWIYIGGAALFYVGADYDRGHGLSAFVVVFVTAGMVFALVAIHRALQARIERWQARRTAREVGRLMTRD